MKNKSHRSERVILSLVLAFTLVLSNGLPAMASPSVGGIATANDFSGGNGGSDIGANETIYFGKYWQNGSGATAESYTKAGVQWRVLSNENGKLLLLSDKALYEDAFQLDKSTKQWASSEVRATLNNTTMGSGFAGDAFNEKEYNAIATTEVLGDDEITKISDDKLFLLSQKEAQKSGYGFTDDSKRVTSSTDFATQVVVYGNIDVGTDTPFWWLRSPGISEASAYGVSHIGQVYQNYGVHANHLLVRPALNLDQSKVLFLTAAVDGKGTVDVGTGFSINTSYTGSSGWKLTLKDSSIIAPTVFTITQDHTTDGVDRLAQSTEQGGTLDLTNGVNENYLTPTVSYTSAVNSGKYISAVVNKLGETSYCNYAKVAEITNTSTAKSGTADVDISKLDAGTYEVSYFSENVNGDKETDYASTITKSDTPITVGSGKVNSGKLSATYKNSGLTAMLGNGFNLSFESDTYDTNVVAESDSALTADASGTMLAGDVAINESTTLTMTNPFTLSSNLYVNGGSQLSIADSLTMAQSGVINFNSSSNDASARTTFRTFTVSGGGNFIANNSLIILNTDLANNTGDKINMSGLTGIGGSVNVQIAYDPCYKTKASVTGNHTFLLLPSTSTEETLKVTALTTDYNGVLYTPTVAYDSATSDVNGWKITAIKAEADKTTKAVSDTANLVNFAWINTINNLQKRMGDLHGGEASNMAWARFQRNNDDVNVGSKQSLSGNLYQLGYDFLIGSNNVANNYFGLSFDVFDGSQSFKIGGGDVKSMSLGAYYTKIYDSGHYFDFILRYGRLENDSTSYDATAGLSGILTKLDYAMNSVTLSGEYGYRANLGKSGLYLEPQAEFIYGYLSGAQATSSTNYLADIDSTNHFVTRLGLAFGQRVKNFNYYLRGSYYHDFAGTIHVKYGGTPYQQDSAQNWWEVSLGGGWNISKVSYFYAELTKHFKDVSNSLNFNVGFRFTL